MEKKRSIFDFSGRMLSGSKIAPKGEICVWNANVCTKSRGKIWFGDLNLIRDVFDLKALAAKEGETVYVLREMDARFTNETKPLLENAVAKYEPNGAIEINEAV